MLKAFAAFTDLGGGRRVILDILPEPNVRNNPWGDDPSSFKTAFRNIATQARAEIGSSRVRIVFSGNRSMSSSRYSQSQWGTGGFGLYWPGASYADAAGVGGYPATGGSNVGYYESAADEMANAVGPGIPILISGGAAPNLPNEAAQVLYAQALANLAASHPQIVGVQWDDLVKGSLDLRVSTTSGLQTGFAAATQGARTGGLDWLFSASVKTWAAARNAANPFDDSSASIFADSINWLSATGITQGCGPRKFCPDDPVTRGQMAAFLVRALKLPAPPTPRVFTDTRGHIFESAISRLAYAGITLGCNPPSNTRFCPNNNVTRGEMAAFLVRAGLAD
jgi:hypothetical protein